MAKKQKNHDSDFPPAVGRSILRQLVTRRDEKPLPNGVPCYQGGDWHNIDANGECTDCVNWAKRGIRHPDSTGS